MCQSSLLTIMVAGGGDHTNLHLKFGKLYSIFHSLLFCAAAVVMCGGDFLLLQSHLISCAHLLCL